MPLVILADDLPDFTLMLTQRFQVHGFRVETANNGATAFSLIEQLKPDAVVLDVMMPELNGYQVCRKIKTNPELKHIKVAMLTAKNTDADRFWAKEIGADLYFNKPCEPAEIVQQVVELLGSKT